MPLYLEVLVIDFFLQVWEIVAIVLLNMLSRTKDFTSVPSSPHGFLGLVSQHVLEFIGISLYVCLSSAPPHIMKFILLFFLICRWRCRSWGKRDFIPLKTHIGGWIQKKVTHDYRPNSRKGVKESELRAMHCLPFPCPCHCPEKKRIGTVSRAQNLKPNRNNRPWAA